MAEVNENVKTPKAPKAKAAPAPAAEEVVAAAPAVEEVAPVEAAPAKKAPAKKAKKAAIKAPLYINGRYVAEKAFPAKPKKGDKPYELSKKLIKITLVKSVFGCLDNQIKTAEALGLRRINSSVTVKDNAAIRGMIFKIKHLVVVEDVK